ncbi:MAG: 5-oxoprolinase subunit PxpA [Trueperaceae bacterium]
MPRTPSRTPSRTKARPDASEPAFDLNADAGESYGPWRMGEDEALFPHLTSVNVACGFHAGDPLTMVRTVRLAAEHGVAVGAHPGLPDLLGFGRRDLAIDPSELHAAVVVQIGALSAVLRAEGTGDLHHVKPHGALHHRMVRDEDAADAVARAIAGAAPDARLVTLAGPAGDGMRSAAARHDVRTVDEAFPDRGYLTDGRLAPRGTDGALWTDPEAVAARAVRMVRDGTVETVDGGVAEVRPDTLCLHGDHPGAAAIAQAVRAAAQAHGLRLAAYA